MQTGLFFIYHFSKLEQFNEGILNCSSWNSNTKGTTSQKCVSLDEKPLSEEKCRLSVFEKSFQCFPKTNTYMLKMQTKKKHWCGVTTMFRWNHKVTWNDCIARLNLKWKAMLHLYASVSIISSRKWQSSHVSMQKDRKLVQHRPYAILRHQFWHLLLKIAVWEQYTG